MRICSRRTGATGELVAPKHPPSMIVPAPNARDVALQARRGHSSAKPRRRGRRLRRECGVNSPTDSLTVIMDVLRSSSPRGHHRRRGHSCSEQSIQFRVLHTTAVCTYLITQNMSRVLMAAADYDRQREYTGAPPHLSLMRRFSNKSSQTRGLSESYRRSRAGILLPFFYHEANGRPS